MAQQATLLGPDLEPRSVIVQSFSVDAIKVTDRQGSPLKIKHDQVLRLSFANKAKQVGTQARVTVALRDGQVLVGKLVPSGDEEAVRLKLDENRSAQISLDQMLSLSLDRDTKLPTAKEDDVLRLATGEVLTGFIETINDKTVGFVVGDADDAIQIPLQLIKALAIANKPTPIDREPGMVWVQMTSGASLLLKDAVLKEDSGLFVGVSMLPILPSRRADEGVSTATSTRLSLPMQEIVTIEPVSARYTLSSLLTYDRQVVSGGEVFGVAMTPRIDAEGSLALHAPTTLGFDVPSSAKRLVFTVALDLPDDISQARRKMAGCELVVYEGEKQISRITLTHDSPPQRINLILSGKPLRLALESGVNGPVLDRVVIRDAELLVSD